VFKQLLEDSNVSRWYRNLAKGSLILADVYLRSLGRFCFQVGTSPDSFARMPPRKMEDTLQDFIDGLESRRGPSGDQLYSPGYIESYLKAVKSWAAWNRKPIDRRIKIVNASRRTTLSKERVPTQDELKRVLYSDKTPYRTRGCIALIAFSGLRLEVLGNYLGADGLRLRDLSELEIKGANARFLKTPCKIVVREELSKSRNQYLTFLCEEGCEILSEYIDRRISEGEVVTPDSGIIVTSPAQAKKSEHFGMKDASPFLRTTKIGDEIRRAMRAVGLPWRPYVFRSYFDTALMQAESRGWITHAYQQFWMGHTGDIESTYTTTKNRLPDTLVEDMRQRYTRVQPLLQTRGSEGADEEKMKRAFKEQLLMVAGFKKEETQKMDIDALDEDDMQRLVKEKLLGVMMNNGSKQKVVPATEVESYIKNGWEYAASLPNGSAIMKLPI
jgi:integrase